MKKIIFALALMGLFSGCSTSHLTPDKAIYVEPLAQATPSAERPIKVTLMRHYVAFTAAGATFYIFDNDKKVAKLESREMTVYYAEPGNHSILLGNSSGEGHANSFSEFKKGEAPEIHFGIDGNFTFRVRRVK